MRENSVFRCCSSTGWDTPIIPQLAPHKRWTVMDSQCHTLQCVWSFFFSSSQDASVTQATSRVNDNVGDYNPFSSPEMVSLCVFNGTAHIIVWYDIQQEPNPLVLWKYIWKEILLQPFFYRDSTLGRQSLSLLHPLNQLYYRHLWSRTQKWVRRMHFSVFK